MSESELSEHATYLDDEVKVAAYREALREVVSDDDVAIDLGAGTGLLGLLACEAGAGTVYAIDRGSILGAAAEIAEANGWSDRVHHIRGMSTEVSLPELADIAICDQIGGFAYEPGILPYFADARARLLKPGGLTMPSAFRLFVAPTTNDECRASLDLWTSRPNGIDVSALQSSAANTVYSPSGPVHPSEPAPVLLGVGQQIASFRADSTDPIKGQATCVVEQAGRIDGFLGWFDAQMSPSVTLTNSPEVKRPMKRWRSFYPIEQPVEAESGDTVTVRVDIRPRLDIISWQLSVDRAGSRISHSEHSTFKGGFLSTSDFERARRGAPVERHALAEVAVDVVGLIDGKRSPVELCQLITEKHPSSFASPAHVESFVMRLLGSVRP